MALAHRHSYVPQLLKGISQHFGSSFEARVENNGKFFEHSSLIPILYIKHFVPLVSVVANL